MRSKIYIVVIISVLVSKLTNGQVNCDINIAEDTISICQGETTNLSVSGNIHNLRWKPFDSLSDSSSANPTASPITTTKYYLTNRLATGNEVIINGDFESGDFGFTSEYGVDCSPGSIIQGNYCVNNRTDVYYSTWSGCNDHTSGAGNMMIMDAATTAGVSVWCQTVNVTPNTDYEFSTWISSIFPVAPALLQFSINDELIGDQFRATATTCEWNQFFEIWNSGPETSVEICIVNQNTEGEGNDFAIDDISFIPVCFDEDSITVVVNDYVEVDLGEDLEACDGDDVELSASSDASFNHVWSDGQTGKNITVNSVGEYNVVVDDGSGCVGRDTIVIDAIPQPILALQSDTVICFQFVPEYHLTAGEAREIRWSTDESTEDIYVTKEGTYAVTLYNGENCQISDSVTIKNVCEPTFLYIPNSFTPNGDGKNETFGVRGENIYHFSMRIFNRWGNLVFETEDPNEYWDGNIGNDKAPVGTYAFFVQFEGISNTTGKKMEKHHIGSVNIIR